MPHLGQTCAQEPASNLPCIKSHLQVLGASKECWGRGLLLQQRRTDRGTQREAGRNLRCSYLRSSHCAGVNADGPLSPWSSGSPLAPFGGDSHYLLRGAFGNPFHGLGQSPSCDWVCGVFLQHGKEEPGTSLPPECWLTQKCVGGPGKCGEDPPGLGGSRQAGGLGSPSIRAFGSPSWIPSFFRRVVVLSVIETAT